MLQNYGYGCDRIIQCTFKCETKEKVCISLSPSPSFYYRVAYNPEGIRERSETTFSRANLSRIAESGSKIKSK